MSEGHEQRDKKEAGMRVFLLCRTGARGRCCPAFRLCSLVATCFAFLADWDYGTGRAIFLITFNYADDTQSHDNVIYGWGEMFLVCQSASLSVDWLKGGDQAGNGL